MTWAWVCAVAGLVSAAMPPAVGDEPPQPAGAADPLDVDDLARKAEAVIQVVLENHVDPPTRQEMWLAGTRALFIGGPPPAHLSARISKIARPEEFRELLKSVWLEGLSPEQHRATLPRPRLTAAFLEGLVGPVSSTQVLAGSDALAHEQFAGNRYVGTGIALSFDETAGYAGIGNVIRGGPMERAGGTNGDLITKIGDRDTHNLPVVEVVELLRGAEGTSVTLELRGSAGKAAPRTVTVTRGPVIFEALEGLHRDRDGKWDYRVEPFPVGYVKMRQVNGSAAHELRRLERQFRADGVAAVILDFRQSSSGDVHQALLLADALMDGGTIGRLRSANGHVQEFHADRECLFRDWPLAVLIDRTTSGGGEWIAAALQDNRVCVVMGESSAGSAFSQSIVHVAGENLSVQLPTGFFERPSGKPLQSPKAAAPIGRVARHTEPLADGGAGGVTPEKSASGDMIGAKRSADERRRLTQPRVQQDGRDMLIVAAVYELRDRIDSKRGRTEQ